MSDAELGSGLGPGWVEFGYLVILGLVTSDADVFVCSNSFRILRKQIQKQPKKARGIPWAG